MRKKLLSLVLIGAIALLLGLSIPVAAIGLPIMPNAFWGDVTVDAAPTPGSTVSAHIGGLSWSTPVDGDSKYGYSPAFMIPADDPERAIEGGHEGDTITFRVDGVFADTSTFHIGGITRLDLHVGIKPPEPMIGFSPASFNFNAIEGGANPSSQTLGIWNAGGETLNWTVGDDAAWLSLAPTGGTSTGETDNVTVSVDILGLSVGVHSATITITDPGATNSPETVAVSLNISSPAGPTIGFSPTSLTFSATEGGANPPSKTLGIWNAGGGTLDWTVSDNALWLSLAPTGGSSTGETDDVTVSVDISDLSVGSHPAIITITAPGATKSPETVLVTLNITELGPPPVGGTAYIPTKPSILGLWIGLLALAVGLGIFGWRRRRARQRSIG